MAVALAMVAMVVLPVMVQPRVMVVLLAMAVLLHTAHQELMPLKRKSCV
jgi:hypothetical protein